MYLFVDRPVERLSRGSRFALWAMRGWKAALGGACCPPKSLAPGFARAGLLAALPDVHMAMLLLERHALEPLTLGCMGAKTVGEDEAILLHMWRDAAMGEEAQLGETIAMLIEEEFARPLRVALSLAAAKLVAAGLAPTGLAPDTVVRP